METNTQSAPAADPRPLVIAVMEDLFFGIQVVEAAKRAGARVVFAKTPEVFAAKLAENPALVVLDLNYTAMQPLELIRELRRDARSVTVPLLGYLPHVQETLRREAEEAGCHRVLPRSAFASQVNALIGEAVRVHRESGAAGTPIV